MRCWLVSTATDSTARNLSLDWRSAVWLWPYLLGMGAISYFSSFDTRTPSSVPLLGLHGPRNELTFGWDILAVALLSLVIYAFAILSRLPPSRRSTTSAIRRWRSRKGSTLGPDVRVSASQGCFRSPRDGRPASAAVKINPAAASSAAPNRLNPIPAHSAAGTLTPTPIVAATLREPSAFITTIDHLPERSFQDSGLLAPDSPAAQNGSRAWPAGIDRPCVVDVGDLEWVEVETGRFRVLDSGQVGVHGGFRRDADEQRLVAGDVESDLPCEPRGNVAPRR